MSARAHVGVDCELVEPGLTAWCCGDRRWRRGNFARTRVKYDDIGTISADVAEARD
jgi:hypothetical protein